MGTDAGYPPAAIWRRSLHRLSGRQCLPPFVIAAGTDVPPVNFTRIKPPGDYTTMDWEVYPPALYDILAYVQGNYAPGDLYITENGAAFTDDVGPDGAIVDMERARYMVAHLEQAARAVQAGIPLKGYFAWTLMDNFEWACGFSQRFSDPCGLSDPAAPDEAERRNVRRDRHRREQPLRQAV
jgi:hypothetical protein